MNATIKITVLYELSPPVYNIIEEFDITVVRAVKIVDCEELLHKDCNLLEVPIILNVPLDEAATGQTKMSLGLCYVLF
jgi:hypothetical protein